MEDIYVITILGEVISRHRNRKRAIAKAKRLAQEHQGTHVRIDVIHQLTWAEVYWHYGSVFARDIIRNEPLED